ncbi:MAG: excisionase [archaeon]|nr:excisionase [archaeon]
MVGTYHLMHKDVEVALLEMDSRHGLLLSILGISNVEHAPPGTVENGSIDYGHLEDWWMRRSIPVSRAGIGTLLEHLGYPEPSFLLTRSMGLSLSDHYWIRPSSLELQYGQVNHYQNRFSEDIGELLFGNTEKKRDDVDQSSPDNTSDGNLMKKWKIIEGERCLLKAGSGYTNMESFNEVIASLMMDSLNVEHVGYRLYYHQGRTVCSCVDFVNPSNEYVPARRMFSPSCSDYSYRGYVKACMEVGVDIVPFLDRMIVIDYLIGNEDRHLNNFGLLRNPDTLEYIGPAPLFDNGSSLGYSRITADICKDMVVPCKPFAVSHDMQLGLVTDISWFDESAFERGMGAVRAFLSENRKYVPEERSVRILEFMEGRKDRLLAKLG